MKKLLLLLIIPILTFGQNNYSIQLDSQSSQYVEIQNNLMSGDPDFPYYNNGDHNIFTLMCWIRVNQDASGSQQFYLHQTTNNYDIQGVRS